MDKKNSIYVHVLETNGIKFQYFLILFIILEKKLKFNIE